MEDEKKENGNNNHKKKIVITGFALALVAGAAALLFYMDYKAHHIATDDAFVDGRVYTIAPKIPGTVKSVNTNDNQMVKKGDLLVEIAPEDYDARMQEALSSVNAEKSKLVEARAKVFSAKAQLELQQANLRQAQIDIKRAESLLEKGAISRERYDKTKTGYDVMHAEVKATQEQLRQAEASVASQTSSVTAREARLKTEELNIGYTKLFAPADGRITKKNVEKGNQVQPGQPLMALVTLDDVWIVANYKETQLEKIRQGQKVDVKVDSYPGTTFQGRVDSIMAGTGSAFSLFPPENATGNYVKVVQRVPVKIVLEKKDTPHILRVGMSVAPTVIIDR
ncbi:MAG TPA: HlyD family secretion protein [Dissulfurispiraceae bacterium]|nr:HlyD family secretion protein [Dissulfurispiraceae bacterium]